jgi:uncharacterized protein YndB with AHSA1/START domain/uncharacterized protein YciI
MDLRTLLAATSLCTTALLSQDPPKPGAKPKAIGGAANYHVVILEHGPKWPAQIGADDMKLLMEHGKYIHKLVDDGNVAIAGPAPDRAYGIVVFALGDRAEVDRLVADDPAVKAQVFAPVVKPISGARAEDIWPKPQLPATPAGLEPIELDVTIPAPLADAWRAWSTSEGAQTFFAPKVTIELAPLGKFEVLFNPAGAPGTRGAEDLRILAFAPERMLAFEWSAPPQFAKARPKRTFVVIELAAAGAEKTRVKLLHQGFAEQAKLAPADVEEWKQVREYFNEAWPVVLTSLEKRFTNGPINWDAPRRVASKPAK